MKEFFKDFAHYYDLTRREHEKKSLKNRTLRPGVLKGTKRN